MLSWAGHSCLSRFAGGVAERSKATVLKTVMRESVSWVRIPSPPPLGFLYIFPRLVMPR